MRPAAHEALRAGLGELLKGYEYAEELSCDAWQFSVEIEVLSGLGLTITDLRWLVRKGYAEHRCEATRRVVMSREFSDPLGWAHFRKRSCFVLTGKGLRVARALPDVDAVAKNDAAAAADGNGSSNVHMPCWDSVRHELRVAGYVVKRYRWPAPNQEVVLAAFQEENWHPRIDDPLPPVEGKDSKQRLHDTVKCLNRNQQHFLIRFRGDGTGEGVAWEFNVDALHELDKNLWPAQLFHGVHS